MVWFAPRATAAEVRRPTCTATDARQVVAVRVESDVPIAGATLRLDYPADAVALPGRGDDPRARARIHVVPAGFSSLANDLDGAVRVALASGTATLTGEVVRIEFDRCAGVAAPPSDRFRCVVEQAAVESGALVDGARCAPTLPRDARKPSAVTPAVAPLSNRTSSKGEHSR